MMYKILILISICFLLNGCSKKYEKQYFKSRKIDQTDIIWYKPSQKVFHIANFSFKADNGDDWLNQVKFYDLARKQVYQKVFDYFYENGKFGKVKLMIKDFNIDYDLIKDFNLVQDSFLLDPDEIYSIVTHYLLGLQSSDNLFINKVLPNFLDYRFPWLIDSSIGDFSSQDLNIFQLFQNPYMSSQDIGQKLLSLKAPDKNEMLLFTTHDILEYNRVKIYALKNFLKNKGVELKLYFISDIENEILSFGTDVNNIGGLFFLIKTRDLTEQLFQKFSYLDYKEALIFFNFDGIDIKNFVDKISGYDQFKSQFYLLSQGFLDSETIRKKVYVNMKMNIDYFQEASIQKSTFNFVSYFYGASFIAKAFEKTINTISESDYNTLKFRKALISNLQLVKIQSLTDKNTNLQFSNANANVKIKEFILNKDKIIIKPHEMLQEIKEN